MSAITTRQPVRRPPCADCAALLELAHALRGDGLTRPALARPADAAAYLDDLAARLAELLPEARRVAQHSRDAGLARGLAQFDTQGLPRTPA
jgi:hypothetical protein